MQTWRDSNSPLTTTHPYLHSWPLSPPSAARCIEDWAPCCCRPSSGCRKAIPPGAEGSSAPSCPPRPTRASRCTTPTGAARSWRSTWAASRTEATSPSSPWSAFAPRAALCRCRRTAPLAQYALLGPLQSAPHRARKQAYLPWGEGGVDGAVPGGEGGHVSALHVPRVSRRPPRGADGGRRAHHLPPQGPPPFLPSPPAFDRSAAVQIQPSSGSKSRS